MDNGNKIELTHKEVALFLGDDLKKFNRRTAKPYDLEAEYAKTKKNHQALVWILLAACFVFVGIGTFITVKSVSNSNEKISVNIDTFSDLNLKELLNMVGTSQNSYDEAVRTKENLEAMLQNDLDSATRKRENDNFTLKSISFYTKKSDLEARQKKIDDDYNKAVRAAHQKYDSQISKAEEEIKKYKTQMDGYDSTMVSQAKKAESSIDSQKQLNDMKFKKQTEKNQQQINELRKQLADEQIRAKEEMQNAIDEVQRTYQAQIVFLMKTHKDFLEKLIAHNGGDGIVTDAGNTEKIQIYFSDERIKTYQKNPEIKCLVGTNTALFSIKKEDDKYFAVNPVEPPAPAPANANANANASQTQTPDTNTTNGQTQNETASSSVISGLLPSAPEPKPIVVYAGDKVDFVVNSSARTRNIR